MFDRQGAGSSRKPPAYYANVLCRVAAGLLPLGLTLDHVKCSSGRTVTFTGHIKQIPVLAAVWCMDQGTQHVDVFAFRNGQMHKQLLRCNIDSAGKVTQEFNIVLDVLLDREDPWEGTSTK